MFRIVRVYYRPPVVGVHPRLIRGRWRYQINEYMRTSVRCVGSDEVPESLRSLVAEESRWALFASRKDAQRIVKALAVLES